MKKIVLTLILFLAISLGLINAQNVNIPDANFKAYLVGNTNINTNGDAEISIAEASNYTGGIGCANCGIVSLEGIEAFTELTVLQVFYNQITSVDLSQNTKITQLLLEQNQLSGDLDLHLLTQLTDFKGHSNPGLRTINIANGNNTNFSRFEAQNCDSLYCIQVDDAAWSYNNWSSYDNQNAGFTEDCGTIVYIPDASFKFNLVENLILNTNNDGMITYTEAASFTSLLNLNNLNISSLMGLEAFTNLSQLNCRNNQFLTIDISANTALTSLDCRDNQLTNLNTASNTLLTDLNCGNNQITNLDISNNTNLIELKCTTNQLSNLNTSNNPNLTKISCGENQITNLDVSANPALQILGASNNQISTLDLSANTNLIAITARLNQLTSFNIANGNNTNVTNSNFRLDANPTLTCIEVDDVAYSNANWNFIDIQTSFSLDCSVPVCTINIPDANFKNYLVGNTNINTNGDTEIQCDEASAFTGNIDAVNLSISDLTGIEAFTEITGLNCWNNNISNVDLSQNPKLLNLTFTTNNLSSLDLSNQPLLETLDLAGNNISSLDVSIFPNLTHLNASGNNLQNINLTNNINLVNLYIANNSITTVDISQNPDLETLDISHLTIGSELDLSGYTNLSKVFVENTGITKLNIANGNNTNFTFFNATNNPSLTCVQVDDVAWSTTNWADWNEIDDVDLFNANCSGGISCTVNIPNANFKSCLVNNMLINTNGDSEISCDEAAAFTGEMNCSWASAGGLTFSDMTGVEAFTAMTGLQLNSQNMVSLDLTANVALETIDFHQNFDLTSLNITGLTNLVELKCFNTGLSTLDVSTNSALELLQCDRMELTSLDVSGLTNLSFIDCYNNDITSIDVTGCTALHTLRMQDNQLANVDFLTANNPIQGLRVGRNPLTTFNVSMHDSLKSVWLDENDLLTSIDLSQNTAIVSLRCYRNDLLEAVNLANTNNENFTYIGLTENPNLTCLQVDDVAWSNDPANWDETAANMYGHFYYSFDAQTNFSADCGITSSLDALENPNLPFSIYPNPTNQQLNIEIENAEISQIDIIDLSGKRVKTISQNNSTLDVSNLNNGIYFIKIKTDQGILNSRFVKQ
ncbi:MAG: T9SS type A sorting domain-containing protein [Saprospiraceae bacterium]